MPIRVICPGCQQALSVKDELAGRRGKCPKCSGVIQIPAAASAPSADAAIDAAVATAGAATATATATVAPAKPPQLSAVGLAPPQVQIVPASSPALKQMPVSGALADPTKLSPEQRKAIIFQGFSGPMEPVRVTMRYRLGALVTALFMVLLPLVYLAIIALVIYGVYLHAVHNTGIIGAARGRGAILTLIVYVAPLVIGGISIFFMIKPLFARAGSDGRTRSLTPMSDPLLFEFVERVCQLVRAPMPKRIDINCDINASASFRRGWISFLTGNDLVLTIGMPLAAGMTLEQFAGVLAHELGHFAQGTGMRLTYVIRSINFWFMRVVYQRDAWDQWLEEASEAFDLRVSWVLYLARLFVWLTRKVLWVLMFVGNAVSGFMMRQMEFDADRYEARLVGSKSFESECRQLMLLQFAYRGAQSDLGMFFREGRLADNLPKLIALNIEQLPEEVKQVAVKLVDESKTGIFDTHPSDRERIDSAYAENAPGVFRSHLPATALFTNFDAAAKGVTLDYYQSIFGNQLPPNSLRPVEELVASQGAEKEKFEARDRFFLSSLSPLRPLRLPSFYIKPSANPQATKREIASNRELMLREAAQYRDNSDAYDKLDGRQLEAIQAACLFSNNLRPKADASNPPITSQAQARQEIDRCQREMTRLGAEMDRFESAAGRRLHGSLELLRHPAIAGQLGDGESLLRECNALLPVVALVSNHFDSMLAIRNLHAKMSALIDLLQEGKKSDNAVRDLFDQCNRLAEQLRSLHDVLNHQDYPFEHAEGTISVARYALRMVPPSDDLGAVFDATETILGNLLSLYGRSVSRLCAIAEIIEKRLGFEPLPQVAKTN